jgi:hypothetical protein
MVKFNIPVSQRDKKAVFSFSVPEISVLFAGSRYKIVPQQTCRNLVHQFGIKGFSFFVGCAEGVDRSFRRELSQSEYKDRCFVACAFEQRLKYFHSYGLFASVVVPKNLSPKAALQRRTIWMVKRCSLVVLFPENPRDNSWGKGSSLVYRASMYHLKPVFVVCSTPPRKSIHYRVVSSNLFGAVDGYWVVPHPVSDGGTCDEEY